MKALASHPSLMNIGETLLDAIAVPHPPGEEDLLCAADYEWNINDHILDKYESSINKGIDVLNKHLGIVYGFRETAREKAICYYFIRNNRQKGSLTNTNIIICKIIDELNLLRDDIDCGVKNEPTVYMAINKSYELLKNELNLKNKDGIEFLEEEIMLLINVLSNALNLLPEGKDGSKYKKFPISFSPAELLVADLAWLYARSQKIEDKAAWRIARDGMKLKNRATSEYSGPFFELVQDIWEALDIKIWSGNLGAKTEQTLYKLRDIKEKKVTTEK